MVLTTEREKKRETGAFGSGDTLVRAHVLGACTGASGIAPGAATSEMAQRACAVCESNRG